MKIALVDDEEKCFNIYQEFIKRYFDETGIRIDPLTFNNGYDILEKFPSEVDAIFMDIDMPQINGIETSIKIRALDEDVPIIFVTNLAKFAIEGYKVHALDFILKPLKYFDFKLELEKINKFSKKEDNEYLWIKEGSTNYKVLLKDIYYIEVIRHDLILHKKDGNKTFRGSLVSIEEEINKINDKLFSRCNNCFLINLYYVDSISKDTLQLLNKEKLQISRNRKKKFVEDVSIFFKERIS